MIQSTVAANRYNGIRVNSLRKRFSTSKIVPSDSIPTTPQQEILHSSQIVEQSEIFASSTQDSRTFTNNTKDQFENRHPRLMCILKILYIILGLFLLLAIILPTTFVYLVAVKFNVTHSSSSTSSSSPSLEQLSIYTNHCGGISPLSLWTNYTASMITMKVNTSNCNFTVIPLYFVSINGAGNHYCLTGYNAIYEPTEQSFQIYAQPSCIPWSATTMLSYAVINRWTVNWVGFYK